MAKTAALALRVSKTVSTISRSAPPSTSASACSLYATRSSSKETLRAPGSFTSGEIDAVRFMGPSTPATQRGFSGVLALYSSAASRATRAAARLISRTASSTPYSDMGKRVALKVLVSMTSAPASR